MKRLLLLLGMSLVVACSGGPIGDEVTEGDEQAVVSGIDAPDPGERLPSGVNNGGIPTPPDQAIDLRTRAFSTQGTRQGPTDPTPWKLPVDENSAK